MIGDFRERSLFVEVLNYYTLRALLNSGLPIAFSMCVDRMLRIILHALYQEHCKCRRCLPAFF
jgi:hypothetical protein